MTPTELREEIPALDEVTYLNTGKSGPSPRRVVEAVSEFESYHEFEAPAGEGMYEAADDALEEARETVAEFVSAVPNEIALTQSTADGINLVAGAIDWEPGDTVVRTDVEHPAGTLPWRRLRDVRGIEIEVVEGDRGRFDPDDFEEAVEDARLVCMSSISWSYGTRLPVREVTEMAHEAGALVLVDGVQSVGQVPVDVGEWGVDFLAASGHKWPLGPWGSGMLYVSDDARGELSPTRIGSRSVEDSLAEEPVYKPSAAMFEVSTMPAAIYRGLQVALETIDDVGLDAVHRRIARLTDYLKYELPDDSLLSPRGYESGLVTFTVDDSEAFVERAMDDGISVRTIPELDAVRASIHVFNTDDDVDRLLEHL